MTTVEDIKARRAKISPGVWGIETNEDGFDLIVARNENGHYDVCGIGDLEETDAQDYNNADFIVMAPTDIDRLLAAVARLQSENEGLREVNTALKAEVQRWRWRSYPNNPELPG